MRFMWTLRSFQMKYLNQIRQHVAGLFDKGSKAGTLRRDKVLGVDIPTEAIGGLTALVGLTAMMGVPISALKNSLLGRESWEWEELMVEELWKSTGFLSKYDMDKFGESHNLFIDALSMFAPPVNVFEAPTAVTSAIVTGNAPSEWVTRKTISQIPLFGKMMESWVGDPLGGAWKSPNYEVAGNEMWDRRKEQERLQKQYKDAMQGADDLTQTKTYFRESRL